MSLLCILDLRATDLEMPMVQRWRTEMGTERRYTDPKGDGTRTEIALGSDGFKRMNSPCLCKWHSKSSRLNINWKVKVWNFQSSIIQTIKNVKINILCLFFSKLFMVPSLGIFTFIKIFAYTVTLQSIHVNDCVSDDNQNSHFPDT